MSLGIIKGKPTARPRNVEAGSETIEAGMPVKVSGGYVTRLVSDEPSAGTPMLGVAVNASDQTDSKDGTVDVRILQVGTSVIRGKASSASNLSEDLIGNSVTFDYSSGAFTVDEDQTSAAGNGLVITDVDVEQGTVDVEVKPEATYLTSTSTS